MYARVGTANVVPGKIDEAVSIWRDSVMPVMSQLSGYQGGRILVDRTNNKVVSMSWWTSAEALEASGPNSPELQAQLAKFAQVFTGPPDLSHYELGAEF
jgi:heme-degrading monooxygenase HmoA